MAKTGTGKPLPAKPIRPIPAKTCARGFVTSISHASAAKRAATVLGSNVSYTLTASSAHTDAVLSWSIETIFAGHPSS